MPFSTQISCAMIVLSVLLGSVAHADDLLSLSLEELLQVNIASRSEEKEVDAPSVVSVITAAEIERFGARNLRDVLDRVVNTQVIGSNLYPHNRISMRGVTQTHTDNKILLLLNGRVVRDGNQGGIDSDMYNLFPVAMVRKIEIIRGPGSVIYGTNAFSGAINIVTFDGAQEKNQLNLTGGSFDSSQINWLTHIGEGNKSLALALHYQDSGGDSFDDINGEFGSSGTYPMNKRGYQFVSSGKYDGFDFNLLRADSSQGNVKSLFQFPSSTLDIARTHAAIGYKYQLNPRWTFTTHLTYNNHEVDFDISNMRSTRTDSQDSLLEFNSRGTVNEHLQVLFGGNYEEIAGTIGNNTESPIPFRFSSYASFIQGTWKFNARHRLTLGVQYNDPEELEGSTSPRLGYIYNVNDTWTSKLLYGEAYRSPFASDKYLDSATLQGNPELKPETIKTYEWEIIRSSVKTHSSVTAYFSQHEDQHTRQVVDGTPTFVNSGKTLHKGLELETRYSFSEAVDLVGNASYQNSEDKENKTSTYNPELMLKVGLSYKYDNGVSMGVFENYFSDPVYPENYEDTATAFNREAESYNLVTANAEMKLERFFNQPHLAGAKLSLYVDNLLDEEIYFPSINRPQVNSIPHHAGRGFYLTYQQTFH